MGHVWVHFIIVDLSRIYSGPRGDYFGPTVQILSISMDYPWVGFLVKKVGLFLGSLFLCVLISGRLGCAVFLGGLLVILVLLSWFYSAITLWVPGGLRFWTEYCFMIWAPQFFWDYCLYLYDW